MSKNNIDKIKEIYDKLSTPEEKILDLLEQINREKLKGDPGNTPVKGEDYFTQEEIEEFLKFVTPKKGKDYFDGKTYSEEEILDLIKPFIPAPIPGEDGSIITPEEVRDKLKELRGVERLSVFDLKDIEWVKGKNGEHIQWSSAGFKIFTDTTLTGDGSSNNPLHVASAGGVTKIIAGTNVTISPTTGLGNVTINSSGGGTPASPTTSIQFNNAGAFGGSANLKWDGTNLLTANVGLIDTSGTCTGGFTGSKIQSNLGVLDEIDLYFGGLQRMSMTRGYFNICPLLCLGNGLNLCGGPLYFDGINAFAQADISDNVTFIGTSFRTNTSFGIRESGATPTKYTYFQGGDQTIDLTYTLPTGYPASNGYALTSTTSGVLSWASAGGGSQTPWGSDIDANYYTLNNLGDISFGLNPSTIYGNVAFNYAGQVYFQGINYMSGSFFSCGCWEFTNGNVIFDNGSTVSFNNSDIYMSNLLTSAGYTGQLYTVNIGGINVVAVSP